MKIINYTIEGVSGAGYRTRMIWCAGENEWRERDRSDGREAFSTRAEAEAELQFARDAATHHHLPYEEAYDIEIVENVFEEEEE